MTKQEAIKKLEEASQLIFEVESEMDLKTSNVRGKGYLARISLGVFFNLIKQSEESDISKL
jgi:hypothetical protein